LEDSAHNDESFDVEASVIDIGQVEDVDDLDEVDGLDADAIIVLRDV